MLFAGSVDLANLFDVRPGRAFKRAGLMVAGLFVAPMGVLAMLPVGGAAALFYFDLEGRIILEMWRVG